MDEDELIKRTKQFALKIIKLIATIPNTIEGRVIANQLAKSGTSAKRGRGNYGYYGFLQKIGHEKLQIGNRQLEMIKMFIDRKSAIGNCK